VPKFYVGSRSTKAASPEGTNRNLLCGMNYSSLPRSPTQWMLQTPSSAWP